MLDSISKLMDLPKDSPILIDEFKHKYRGSWVYINDELHFLEDCNKIYIKTMAKLFKASEIKSIVSYNPPVGIYSIDTSFYMYVSRLNKKQWVKSYAPFKNYSLSFLENTNDLNFENLKPADCLFHGEIALSPNALYIRNKKLGIKTRIDRIQLVTDTFSIEEIRDLWKTNPLLPPIQELEILPPNNLKPSGKQKLYLGELEKMIPVELQNPFMIP
jgi:hypothetical protein